VEDFLAAILANSVDRSGILRLVSSAETRQWQPWLHAAEILE